MSGDLTVLLAEVGAGRRSAEELLPLVYDELRLLARSRLARERPGQTPEPTALVHEAWMRLVELRWFSGLTTREAADALGVSVGTLERDLRFARAWLRTELSGPGSPTGTPPERSR